MNTIKIFTLLTILSIILSLSGLNAQILNVPHIIENKGQFPDEVLFIALAPDLKVTVTNDYIIYETDKNGSLPIIFELRLPSIDVPRVFDKDNLEFRTKLDTYYNFFIGANPENWATDVGLYKEVESAGSVQSIKFSASFSKEEFVISYKFNDGSEFGKFQINTVISDAILNSYISRLDADLTVEIRLPYRNLEIKESKRDMIMSEDMSQLAFSRHFGGYISDMDLDNEGNIVLVGICDRYSSVPTTEDAYDKVKPTGGGNKIFISKLSSDASKLIYSTFFGTILSSSHLIEKSIHIKLNKLTNNIFICSYLDSLASLDLPITKNAIQNVGNGGYQLFITKFNRNGNELLFSTILGGSSDDKHCKIDIDNQENVFITATTNSTDFPISSDAFQDNLKSSDIIFSAINTIIGEIKYSTYLGGTSTEIPTSIALDNDKNVIIVGRTYSNDFPTTTGAFIENNINKDFPAGFIVKFKYDFSKLIFSTLFIGGKKSYVYLEDLSIDKTNNIYFCGRGSVIPQTTNNLGMIPYRDDLGVSFITKLNSDGTDLLYSTILTGKYYNSYDIFKLYLDDKFNAYFAGFTDDLSYPISDNAFCKDYRTMFLTKINPDATQILYSTFFGGYYWDTDIIPWLDQYVSKMIANDNYLLIAGSTLYNNFPVTSDSKDFGVGSYITKFDFTGVSIESDLPSSSVGIKISPIPASDYIYISDLNKGACSLGNAIKIYNTLGQCVINYELQITNYENARIDISQLPSGVYFVRLISGGQAVTKQFVVVK